jgi:hypothetical protein
MRRVAGFQWNSQDIYMVTSSRQTLPAQWRSRFRDNGYVNRSTRCPLFGKPSNIKVSAAVAKCTARVQLKKRNSGRGPQGA